MRFVTVKKFAEQSGYSINAINCKIDKGIWLEGKEWIKAPDGRRLIDLKEFEKWVTQPAYTIGVEGL